LRTQTTEQHCYIAVDDDSLVLKTVAMMMPKKFDIFLCKEPSDIFSFIRKAIDKFSKFSLITDLEMGVTRGTEILSQALDSDLPLQAGLLMSGSTNLEREGLRLKPAFEQKQTPFLTLEKPFQSKDLISRLELLRLKNIIYKPETVDLAPDPLIYSYENQPHLVLRAARETLGLSTTELAQLISLNERTYTEDAMIALERDPSRVLELSAEQWFFICEMMGIPTESFNEGYSRIQHLCRMRRLCLTNKNRFIVKDALSEELAYLQSEITETTLLQKIC